MVKKLDVFKAGPCFVMISLFWLDSITRKRKATRKITKGYCNAQNGGCKN